MVRRGIASDSRIGNRFIYAGAGYGGSCFPKDVKAIIRTADEYGYGLKIMKAVDEVNELQKEVLFKKISTVFNNKLRGLKVAVWGLAFKPNTDDMREAPSLTLIRRLNEAGAIVTAYDPVAMDEGRRRIGDTINYGNDAYDCVIDADALVLVTEWNEFKNPNWKLMQKVMRDNKVFDGRNIYEKESLTDMGFEYYGIGR